MAPQRCTPRTQGPTTGARGPVDLTAGANAAIVGPSDDGNQATSLLTSNARASRAAAAITVVVLNEVTALDVASKKNLRLVCKDFREGVDTATMAVFPTFNVDSVPSMEALETWVSGTALMQRTRSITIFGPLSQELAIRAQFAIASAKPPISEVVLDMLGSTADIILAAPLDNLQDLRVLNSTKTSMAISVIKDNASLSNIRSLRLEQVADVDAATLATALAKLLSLESLCLSNIAVTGELIQSDGLGGLLRNATALEFENCPGIASCGLFAFWPSRPPATGST